VNEQRSPDQGHDRFRSAHYTEFVEELTEELDLDAALAEALTNAPYAALAALGAHVAETLDLDTGLRAALSTAKDDEGMSEVVGIAGPTDQLLGYRGPAACQIAGITYRQLDYWARTGLVWPSICGASGSGIQRLYSLKDVLLLKVVKRLLDTGPSLQNIRPVVEHLRRRKALDLIRITLFSDGTSVYECTSPEEVVDLLQGGQGVFGIAVDGAIKEIAGSINQYPPERADGGRDVVLEDELSEPEQCRDDRQIS
jgi:DNA-binding transcriptional MerR regulator